MSSWQYKGLVSWLIVLAAKGAGRELGFALARRGKQGYPDNKVVTFVVTCSVCLQPQQWGLELSRYNCHNLLACNAMSIIQVPFLSAKEMYYLSRVQENAVVS